ncbi:MAG: sialidase family protein, partial [Chitinophagales bacterium]
MKKIFFTLLFFLSMHHRGNSQPDIHINVNNTWNGENTLAVNPTDSNNLVVAWMKLNLFAVTIAVSHSSDGGQAWSEPVLMQHTQLGYTSADPGITVDENGIFYLSFIDFSSLLTGGAVYVTHSNDKGESWSTAVEVINVNTSADQPVDRPWMTIDESNGIHHGRIYLVTKSYFAAAPPHAVWLMYSDDGGATWSSPNQVDSIWKVGLLLNSMGVPTVGNDGALYKSTDGGASWSGSLQAVYIDGNADF